MIPYRPDSTSGIPLPTTDRDQPRRPLASLRSLALGVFAALLPFMALEFVLAAVDFQYHPPLVVPLWGGRNDQEMLSERGQYQPHPYWFWELRPGALLDPVNGERVNALGLRGPEPGAQPPAGRARLAALGDSSTFGLGAPDVATFARHLERIAPLEVLNFGVPGYNAFQGLKLYEGRVRRFRPNIVLVAFGAINEINPRDPNAEERFRITSRSSPAAIALGNALMRFRGYQLLRWGIAELRGEEEMAEESQRRLITNMQRRDRGEPYKRNVDVATFERVLRELVDRARADAARVLLVSPPRSLALEERMPELLEYTSAIFEVGAEVRAPVCDVRRAFHERDDPRLLRDDAHPSAQGHELYAKVLADCLAREGWIDSRR